MIWLKAFFGWFGNGPLGRILDTVDKKTEAGTQREVLKADVIITHLKTRPQFMRSGGFWLMLMFATPLAVWFASVCLYSMLWCELCYFPQTWTVAALPPPLDDWSGTMITSIFGVVGLDRIGKGLRRH